MAFYGKWDTYKVVYRLAHNKKNDSNLGSDIGVALVEAGDRAHAMQVFNEQYAGEYFTINSIEKL